MGKIRRTKSQQLLTKLAARGHEMTSKERSDLMALISVEIEKEKKEKIQKRKEQTTKATKKYIDKIKSIEEKEKAAANAKANAKAEIEAYRKFIKEHNQNLSKEELRKEKIRKNGKNFTKFLLTVKKRV